MRLLLSRIYSFFLQKTHKKAALGRAKVLTLQKAVHILKKKIKIIIPDKFQKKSQVSKNLGELLKSYKVKFRVIKGKN